MRGHEAKGRGRGGQEKWEGTAGRERPGRGAEERGGGEERWRGERETRGKMLHQDDTLQARQIGSGWIAAGTARCETHLSGKGSAKQHPCLDNQQY